MFQVLYEIEVQCRELSPVEQHAERQTRSVVIWETMRENLTTDVVGFSRTEKVFEAKRYFLRQ
ncbi:MAG: hypothetical protein AAFP90_12170 [Planctomycetota bacterium]